MKDSPIKTLWKEPACQRKVFLALLPKSKSTFNLGSSLGTEPSISCCEVGNVCWVCDPPHLGFIQNSKWQHILCLFLVGILFCTSCRHYCSFGTNLKNHRLFVVSWLCVEFLLIFKLKVNVFHLSSLEHPKTCKCAYYPVELTANSYSQLVNDLSKTWVSLWRKPQRSPKDFIPLAVEHCCLLNWVKITCGYRPWKKAKLEEKKWRQKKARGKKDKWFNILSDLCLLCVLAMFPPVKGDDF